MNGPTDIEKLINRYHGATLDQLTEILCPVQIPIASLGRTIARQGGSRWSAPFTIRIEDPWKHLMFPGHTGKFVPAEHVEKGGPWREIVKGRLLQIDEAAAIAHGEIYAGSGSSRTSLEESLASLAEDDYLEIDQYGASAKVLSSLVESTLMRHAASEGLSAIRMPEDVARHIGAYYRYDFRLTDIEGESRRVEVKSLWGTNTVYARLIASKTATNPTSSPRFDAQDIFAVSLFLRTGNINDFAFARSVPRSDEKPYGLPTSSHYPEHVHQNPKCEIGDGSWYESLAEVWNLP